MSEFTKMGGAWLGAARSYVQRKFRNGSRVDWGTNDVLEPAATIRQVEEIAAVAVDAAFPEVDKLKEQVKELQGKYLKAQLELRSSTSRVAGLIVEVERLREKAGECECGRESVIGVPLCSVCISTQYEVKSKKSDSSVVVGKPLSHIDPDTIDLPIHLSYWAREAGQRKGYCK